MEYLKIADIPEDYITKTDKFIINKLIPIGFKELENNNFVFLFLAYQEFSESYIYLQLFFKAANAFEYDTFKKHPMYIKNFKQDEKLVEMYKNMITGITKDNVYCADFDMKQDTEFADYHYSYAIRAYDNNSAEKLKLFMPESLFIIFNCAFKNHNVFSPFMKTTLFNNFHLDTIIYENVVDVLNFGSVIVDNNKIDTHYIIKTESRKLKLNYRSARKFKYFPDKMLNEEEFAKLKEYQYIQYIFSNENDHYVLYDDEEFSTTVILVFNDELINKTNFIDQYNTIFKEEKRNENS